MTETWLILALAAACLGLVGTCLYLWRTRGDYTRGVAALNREILDAAETAAFGKRVALPASNVPEIGQLGDNVNRLFDALSTKDRQMRQREALFQDLANTMPEVVLVHRDRVIFANSAASALMGLTPEQLTGRPVTDLVRPAYRAMTRKNIAGRLAGEPVPDRYEIQLISGEEGGLWVEATGTMIDYRGQKAILSIARDVSYRKSIEANLGRGKQQAQITLESIGEGVITADTEGVIDYLNGAAEKLTGFSRENAVGKLMTDLMTLVDETDRKDLGDPVARCLSERRQIGLGRRALMISKDGTRELSVELTASPIIGAGDTVAGAVVIMHDVTEIRGLTRRISYQAAHDALTGLINRGEFERRLAETLEGGHGDSVNSVLCYMDLDRFKAVNDTCGHLAGDNMLREVAKLIRDQVRDSDFVARLGGDEFGMLLIRCPLDKARQIADDVCNAIRDYRFVWQDRIFTIGISIGLVEVSRESGTLKDLLSAADSACYVAKQQGRGRVHVYSARDEVSARQRGDIHWLRQLQVVPAGEPLRAPRPAGDLHGRAGHPRPGAGGAAADDRRGRKAGAAPAVHSGGGALPVDGRHRPVGRAGHLVRHRPRRDPAPGRAELQHQPVGPGAGGGRLPGLRRGVPRPQPGAAPPHLLRGERDGGDGALRPGPPLRGGPARHRLPVRPR